MATLSWYIIQTDYSTLLMDIELWFLDRTGQGKVECKYTVSAVNHP